MIVEVADLRTTPEQADQFAQALRRGVAEVLSKSPGYQRHRVLASQESPGRFLLQVEWDSLEAHTASRRRSRNGGPSSDRSSRRHRWWSTSTWSMAADRRDLLPHRLPRATMTR
jgi:heme-degrading monooxygenase HmoA